MQGEHLLLLAMLEDAIHCYQKHLRPRNKNGRQLFQDAEQWIMRTEGRRRRRSDDEPLTFSFENVCEALGLDADYIRAGLQRWRNAQLPVTPAGCQGMEFPG